MDQFLAEYYGTATQGGETVADDDIEKMAQLTLLTKEASAEGIDLSEFSDDELVTMAGDLYGGGAAVETDDSMEKEAAAKFEEADFLGRVMAHSMENERWEIEKEAGRLEAAGKAVEGFGQRVSGGAKTLFEKNKERVMSGGAKALEKVKGAPESIGSRLMTKKERMGLRTRMSPGDAQRETSRIAKRRGAMALGGAGALAAGGAGAGIYAATRDKKSSDSAFEQLVLDRANEHLEAAGLIEKEASEDFETAVDRAALELLETNGYPVEWY